MMNEMQVDYFSHFCSSQNVIHLMSTISSLTVHPDAKALIFDIDGTLADSMPVHFRAWKKVLKKHGFDYFKELFLETAGMSTDNIIRLINQRYGLSMDPDAVSAEKEEAYMEIAHEVQPIAPVVAIARQYHGILPMAAGTGGYRHIVEQTIENIGLSDIIKIIVTTADVARNKPAPDTFLKCAEILGVEPRFCQVFEDAELGLQAGRAAGMIVTDIRPAYEPDYS